MDKLKLRQAVIVEGRDDVRAVSEACDALIIPTHGYGISRETWLEIEKAYEEKGLIVFTDPDHAGREIRKRLDEKFPGVIHAHLDRDDARAGDDIGIENAKPEAIAEALSKSLELAGRQSEGSEAHSDSAQEEKDYADISGLNELGLAGAEGSSAKRAALCKELGIGYCNASSLIKKLKRFGIDKNELKKALEKCK